MPRKKNINRENKGYKNYTRKDVQYIRNKIVHHEKLVNIPKILETPYVSDGSSKYPPYLFEIKMFREGKYNSNLINDIVSYYKDCKSK